MDEFSLIDTIFSRLTTSGSPALGLGDDAALFSPPDGYDLVVTKDMMVSGRHFFSSDPMDLVARKLLRVNLSDLAAMGAKPLGYLLGLAFPDKLDSGLATELSKGLLEDQKEFGIALYGGDTVSGAGKLVLSLTAIGYVEKGQALRRNGAKPGDLVFVSGTIGDAALGLKCLLGGCPSDVALVRRYHVPVPRLALGANLVGLASAALDISDGMIADLGHICAQSRVGMRIEARRVPLSDAARHMLADTPDLLRTVLTGGDDYELAFTAPPENADAIKAAAKSANVPIMDIGMVEKGDALIVVEEDGTSRAWGAGGFRHP
ncbi:thiamine-monophosphate kinase [Iodidimonas gelatinilytica]|uniref:Thiamine-monophosphate kinase n=1 Tax=Iodidimonas gelatinilytica TaxID=1236966 RepID=A0A5A7MSC2_9PROT|nr:thiamine-phosphate kinase [Iodidimonas gelatinilytica]GEQ98113.1 thiamine-monophosphate kinase [Iodidimonas gelatinilytica]